MGAFGEGARAFTVAAVLGAPSLVAQNLLAQSPGPLLASDAAREPAGSAPAATTEEGVASCTVGDDGSTAVADPALRITFELPRFWLCVPGSGALPQAVAVLQLVDASVRPLVSALRKTSVGAFEIAAKGVIPCVLEVTSPGNGKLPQASVFERSIKAEAERGGVSLSSLHVGTIVLPAGRFIHATFTITNSAARVQYESEYIGKISPHLIVAAFVGSTASTAATQGTQVMGSFR